MKNKQLQQKIIKMAKKDQETRSNWLKAKDKKKISREIVQIDKRNTIEARKIIKKYGWPSFDLIGKRASRAFWLIIQHADQDPKFQAKCLDLLKKAVENKQAFPENEAYLTDRVLAHQGKKQKFGTQFKRKGTKFVLKPIQDKKNVNKRRKKYGLNTLEENIEEINKRLE